MAGAVPKEAYFMHITEEGIRSWNDLVYQKGETLEHYLDRVKDGGRYQAPMCAFACVDADGWLESGSMGWFGMSTNNMDEMEWSQQINAFVEAQPDDAVLISVDCHI